RIMSRDFIERGEAALVLLYGNDAPCAICEEGAGQASGAGAHLHDGRVLQVAGRAGDLAGQVEIEKKVLPERLLRPQFMAIDHVAQRRKAIGTQTGTQAASAV